jgi:hypothetical protein
LFLQCFEEGHADPKKRPSAAEWALALTEAESRMAVCSLNTHHIYPGHLVHCPWCERRALQDGVDPFPMRSASTESEPSAKPASQTPAGAVALAQVQARSSIRSVDPVVQTAGEPTGSAVSVPPGPATDHVGLKKREPALAVWLAAAAAVIVIGIVGASSVKHSGSAAHKRQPNIAAANADLRMAKLDLEMATPEDPDVKAAAGSFAAAEVLCRNAIAALGSAGARGAADPDSVRILGQAGQLSRSAKAEQLALAARIKLDAVTETIEASANKKLTQADADALKAKLVRQCKIARTDCANALEQDPGCVAAWVERVRGYRLIADDGDAKQALDEALAAFPGNPLLLKQQAEAEAPTPR